MTSASLYTSACLPARPLMAADLIPVPYSEWSVAEIWAVELWKSARRGNDRCWRLFQEHLQERYGKTRYGFSDPAGSVGAFTAFLYVREPDDIERREQNGNSFPYLFWAYSIWDILSPELSKPDIEARLFVRMVSRVGRVVGERTHDAIAHILSRLCKVRSYVPVQVLKGLETARKLVEFDSIHLLRKRSPAPEMFSGIHAEAAMA